MDEKTQRMILNYLGVVSLALSSLRELVTNWKADFAELITKKRAIKVILNTISTIYNALNIIRCLGQYYGYIVYQGNPLIAAYLFSVTVVLGVMVGAAEDYYKRYSCTQPNFLIVFSVTMCLTLSFAAIFVAQGIFLFTRESPGAGERTTGIVMIAISTVLAFTILTTMPVVNKTLLRLSLLSNFCVVPGMFVYLQIITFKSWKNLKFLIREIMEGLVLYVTYTYPILILTELFVLALISRQRQFEGDMLEVEIGEQNDSGQVQL